MRWSGLVHSSPPATRLTSRAPQAAIAVAAHAAVIVAAVALTLPRVEQAAVPGDTALVYLSLPQAEHPELPRLAPPAMHELPDIRGFKTLAPPVTVPQQIEAVDLASQFDPREYSGMGFEGGTFGGAAGGVVGGEGDDPNYVWPSANLLDEPPVLISSPPLGYPASMRNLGVEGYVVLQFVIDTLGRAEWQSLEIVQASHIAFIDSARSIICNSRYRPGRVRGSPVRVRAVIRIDFSLTR
jgi:TonB family protein